MIRRLVMLIALALTVVVMTGPALAASDTTTMTGTVATIDKNGKSFTLKADKEEKMHTFQVKDASVIKQLKKGQHVQVTYKKDGSQMVAEKITDKPRAAAKK